MMTHDAAKFDPGCALTWLTWVAVFNLCFFGSSGGTPMVDRMVNQAGVHLVDLMAQPCPFG